MTKEIKINLVSVGLFLLLVFALGYFTKKEVANRKVIRQYEISVSALNKEVDKKQDTLKMKDDTISFLKEQMAFNAVKIVVLKGEIKKLAAVEPAPLPPNRAYSNLQELHPDTSVKNWPFSDNQVTNIEQDEQELAVKSEEVFKYESLTGMLNYNIQLLSKSDSIKSNQLQTCLGINDDKDKVIDLKNREIKEWRKKGSNKTIWAASATGVAAIFLVFLLF